MIPNAASISPVTLYPCIFPRYPCIGFFSTCNPSKILVASLPEPCQLFAISDGLLASPTPSRLELMFYFKMAKCSVFLHSITLLSGYHLFFFFSHSYRCFRHPVRRPILHLAVATLILSLQVHSSCVQAILLSSNRLFGSASESISYRGIFLRF